MENIFLICSTVLLVLSSSITEYHDKTNNINPRLYLNNTYLRNFPTVSLYILSTISFSIIFDLNWAIILVINIISSRIICMIISKILVSIHYKIIYAAKINLGKSRLFSKTTVYTLMYSLLLGYGFFILGIILHFN